MKVLDVGLTGGIGCGKSLALRIFQALGCDTLDADAIYHSLIKPGEPLHAELVKAFGDQILDGRGAINRKKLGELVFADKKMRDKLNAITHPAVIREQKRIKDNINKRLQRDGVEHAVIVTDAALMIEAGSYKDYDAVIVVVCKPETQLLRLMERDGMSEEEARSRIEAQMPAAEKAEYANYVLNNDAGPLELIKQVETTLNNLFERMV